MRRSICRNHFGVLIPMLCACASVVHAGRPLVTDDARIMEARTCQLESGYRHDHDGHEWTAVPACNPNGFFDATIGFARTQSQGATSERVVLQAKTVLRSAPENGWGVGLTIGAIDQTRPGGSPRFGETYLNVPVTFSWHDDAVLLHVNAGLDRNRYGDGTHPTWGAATEIGATSRVTLLAETFGTDRGRPFWQAGARFTLVPGRVQLDATLGGEWRGNTQTRWWGVGARLVTPPL